MGDEERVRLAIVGGGKMGEALLSGLLGAGWAPADLAVVEPVEARRADLAKSHPGVALAVEAMAADGIVVATKPNHVEQAARAATEAGPPGRVLSIAAGVPLERLEAWFPAATPVVRAMPNTPAMVGAGAAAIAGGSAAVEADLTWAEEILGAVGVVVRVPETLLDAVTGLSGSGPAYVFLVAEALTEAGVLAGLPRPTATTLAHQTLLGSARLLAETGESPETLRHAVTSPGGTTAAGLAALEDAGVRAAFLAAVRAATARSVELGRG